MKKLLFVSILLLGGCGFHLQGRQPPPGEKGDAVRHWHTPFDTMDVLSARSLQIVGEVVLAAWPELEKL